MPIYEYRCPECHQVFEEWTKVVDDMEAPLCPVCDAPAERIISNSTFVLKGGGWYATDYGPKGKEATAESSTEPTSAPLPQTPPTPAAQPSQAGADD
ncbi:MAG: zinc ribbon domain-containing protein [Desulfovibrionaceae bacterium]|nr:zinc ribbon domain-containing protein [Desulfovibrionaceae bacterium]